MGEKLPKNPVPVVEVEAFEAFSQSHKTSQILPQNITVKLNDENEKQNKFQELELYQTSGDLFYVSYDRNWNNFRGKNLKYKSCIHKLSHKKVTKSG